MDEKARKELEKVDREQRFRVSPTGSFLGYGDYLTHREEKEVKKISSYFRDFYDNKEKLLQTVLITGPIGSGKAALIRRFRSLIKEEIDKKELILVRIRSSHKFERRLGVTGLSTLLKHLIQDIKVQQGVKHEQTHAELFEREISEQELEEILLDLLRSSDKKIVMILGSLSSLYHRYKDDLLSILSKVREKEITQGILFVFTWLGEWVHMHKQAEEILDGFSYKLINLAKFNENELREIVQLRADRKLKSERISSEAIDLIAFIASKDGNAEKALLFFHVAARNAYVTSNQKTLYPDHVRRASELIYRETQVLTNYKTSIHNKLILVGILETLKKERSAFVSIEKAIELYKIKCEEFEEESKNLEGIWINLDELYNMGVIMIKMRDEIYNMEHANIDFNDERRKIAKIAVVNFPVNKGLKDLNKWLIQIKKQKDFRKSRREEMKE